MDGVIPHTSQSSVGVTLAVGRLVTSGPLPETAILDVLGVDGARIEGLRSANVVG